MSERISAPEPQTSVELFNEGELPPRDEAISILTNQITSLKEQREDSSRIDAAQELVDGLNFKSTAEDHVHAKKSLQEAKDTKINELTEIDYQLTPLEELWAQCGGKEIDAAQELVDGLNFKSTAEDHVHAKKSLQEAKDSFYDKLKTAMETEDPTPTPEDPAEDPDGGSRLQRIKDAAIKIKDHGLEGIDRQEKEEHASRGLRARELREKRIRELNRNDNDPTPEDGEDGGEKKRGFMRAMKIVGSLGILATGTLGGLYAGTKLGYHIDTTEQLNHAIRGGAKGMNVFERAVALVDHFMLRGGKGDAYGNFIKDQADPSIVKSWLTSFSKMDQLQQLYPSSWVSKLDGAAAMERIKAGKEAAVDLSRIVAKSIGHRALR